MQISINLFKYIYYLFLYMNIVVLIEIFELKYRSSSTIQ